MVHVDMTQPDPRLQPGIDLWRVAECNEADSKSSGDPMLRLKLVRDNGGDGWIFDNIMLGGRGIGIGKSKLRAFGIASDFVGDLDPLSLIGVRVWAETVVHEYDGKQRLQVDINALKHAGYQKEDDPPGGRAAPPKQEDYNEIPF